MLDATTPTLPNACVGIYKVRCVQAPAGGTSGVMRLIAPSGRVVVDMSFPAGLGTAISFSDELKFVVTQNAPDFKKGEGFNINVTAWSVTVQSVGNTGNGTCVVDPIPLLAGAQIGTYRVRCTSAPNTFVLRGPAGNLLQTANIGGGGFAQFNTQLQFKVQNGVTDFAVGDGFDLVVERRVWLDEPEKLRTGRKFSVSTQFASAAPAGKGSIVMDPISPTRSDTQVGVYKLKCTSAAGDGTFDLTGPGIPPLTSFPLAAGQAVVAKGVYLTIRKGTIPFAAA